MALQSTGAISLNDVQTEFGGSNPIGINEYYRGGSNVPDTPANSSIPTSGTIAMDDFYGGDNTPASSPATLEYNWSHYAWGLDMGTLTLYWLNDATGTLTIIRTLTGQKHTAALQPWDSYTEDFSPYAGQTGRIVYRYQGGGGYRGDVQIDNMELINGAVTVDLDPTVARTDGLWQQQTRGTSTYSSTSFSNTPQSASTTYGWQYDSGGTPSSNTGNSRDADGSSSGYYAYVEASGNNGNTTSYHWLRSTSTYTLASSGSPPPPPPPSATYAFTSTPSSINEGSSSAFTVGTTNVPNSTILYWTTQHVTSQAADFSANSGYFVINNTGSGSFTVSITTDTLTEATQYFRIQVRTGSTSGPVVATSNQVSINNISGYTWTTTSFSPNSASTTDSGTSTYDTNSATTSAVTVGSGVQTFPFSYTLTNYYTFFYPSIRVYRNNSLILTHQVTGTSGTFSFSSTSTANQIHFRTTVYAEHNATSGSATLRIFSNGTTQVWQHTHTHTESTEVEES